MYLKMVGRNSTFSKDNRALLALIILNANIRLTVDHRTLPNTMFKAKRFKA